MDIADLVLEDHHRQRKSFALLDETDPANHARLAAIWGDLADFLEAHATSEDVGSDGWWEAVGAARAANTEHMGEEEDEVLPHLRRRAAIAVRTDMGLAFEVAKTSARRAQLDTSAKAPDDYVAEHT